MSSAIFICSTTNWSNSLVDCWFHSFLRSFHLVIMSSDRQYPNIIICGTPGVGKTRLCQEICSQNPALKYVNLNELVKQNHFIIEFDNENQCDIVDDDALNDYLENTYFLQSYSSGLVIDYHSSGIVPDNNQIHGVFVLRCDDKTLHDRLKNANKLCEKKIEQYIQSEAFQVCLNEAREAFDESMVYELRNQTNEDLKKNLDYLSKWIDRWPFYETID